MFLAEDQLMRRYDRNVYKALGKPGPTHWDPVRFDTHEDPSDVGMWAGRDVNDGSLWLAVRPEYLEFLP